MKDNTIFVEAGGYIINLDHVAYLKRDGDPMTVAFAGGSELETGIVLNGEDANRFEQQLRSNRTVVK
jgi:hypothetical protein